MDLKILRQLPGTLYSALVMELFERFAYYGMVVHLSIFLVTERGFDAEYFGRIYAVFTMVLYFLPIISGALADRFGYKKALIVAFTTLPGGYYLLGTADDTRTIFIALGLIAIGGSVIKPTIAGTVTRTTEEGPARTVGFGLYYMMVNAGGLIGPVVAGQFANRQEFTYLFWTSAAACALMLVQALIAYREPVTAEERAAGKSLIRVFVEMFVVIANWRFVLLLIIFSGFWGMINVLFGFMPLYINTFVDLSGVESLANQVVDMGHWLSAGVFLALDALLIVVFQAAISYLTRKWRTVSAMLVGTGIATLSWILPAIAPVAWVVALGIVIWSVGEMTCSARFFEYCGTIAPQDRVAMYLGYSFLSICLGNFYSGIIAGSLYQRFIQEPYEAGLDTSPEYFFGGIMMMGLLAALGLALYAKLVGERKA